MALKGFDREFRDLPHYIYAITAKIWEGRGVDLINKYYAKKCPVRSPTGLVVGTKQVIDATLATLAEFPDRRLLGEDVVWKRHGDSYLSSHRIISTATHLGDGAFGRATNKPVRYRIIADCLCAKNQVIEEWLIRDQGAIAKCLGMSPRELAQRQVDKGETGYFLPAKDVKSDYRPKATTDGDAKRYRDLWLAIWHENQVSLIADHYHHAAAIDGPSGARPVGKAGAEKLLLSYLAAIDGPKLTVEDLFACENERGKTVAMRWSVKGKCSGRGVLTGGKLGAPVYIMGLSHARMVDGRIDVEWIVADEVALWKQVL